MERKALEKMSLEQLQKEAEKAQLQTASSNLWDRRKSRNSQTPSEKMWIYGPEGLIKWLASTTQQTTLYY
ncbi:hypothetical protein EAI_06870 [Harpegnathos saltator]|uniref:Uncharacterized protein n=1 Tax=Harpegnathos saltator TaxID=610380 RepID=E2B2D7_HARSA|nr:hypothetical protein EAI_06870 [Harpegnathos saltator]